MKLGNRISLTEMLQKVRSSNLVYATIMLFGALGCCLEASAQLALPQFEPASFDVPAGNTCRLHPEGNPDPRQTLTVHSDDDGVVRFLAVRATLPGSVDHLALECLDSDANSQTYSIDLRAESTFGARPFNPALANAEFRPGLSGDPLSYTQQELLQGGYGLRPDPAGNPEGYKRWLASAIMPAYKLRGHQPSSLTAANTARPAQPASPSAGPETSPVTSVAGIPGSPGVIKNPSNFWTGAILTGSYKKGATTADTYSYLYNESAWTVPSVAPGGFETGVTGMSIWSGLDQNSLLQAITWVSATSTAASYSIAHQDFGGWIKCPASPRCTNAGNDHAGVTFTPNAGDTISAQEWYCDAKGNLSLHGGYACTFMSDVTQGIVWDCSQAGSSGCQSYALPSKDLVNGFLGQSAEYIIEMDTCQFIPSGPGSCGSSTQSEEWPDFSPVTMYGEALVVKGTAITGTWVSTTKCSSCTADPNIYLNTDGTASKPFVRGDAHLLITLVTGGGVKWDEKLTNIYSWNGSNFNTYSVNCATSIAVGANSRGLTNGTPWITDCAPYVDGNFSVYQMQTGGAWVKMQSDIGTQVAVSPVGNIAWAIQANGSVVYWNGSKFVSPAKTHCATSIGVGVNSRGLTNGTPWITGCATYADGNHDIYQMQTGGDWVLMQSDIARQVAVSPDANNAWAIQADNNVVYWNGSKFVSPAKTHCARSIAVGANSRGLTDGTPWITGCTSHADGNNDVYQMQTGGAWVLMQGDVGTQVAVSPVGNLAWAISTLR